jgi:hypothetical protein
METDSGMILRLPAPEAPAPRARQKWEPGETVKIGSLMLRVEEKLPPARKGEGARVRLSSHDLSRQYIWTPFRGLKVLGGAPKRRKRRAASAPKAAPRARVKAVKIGLLARVWKSLGGH